MKKFLIFLGFNSIIWLFFLLGSNLKWPFVHPLYWAVLAFFGIVTWAIGALTQYVADKNNALFQTGVFGGMGLKLLLCLIFLLGFYAYNIDNKVVFTVDFIIAYFFFTGFEVYSLLTNLRPLKNKGKTANK